MAPMRRRDRVAVLLLAGLAGLATSCGRTSSADERSIVPVPVPSSTTLATATTTVAATTTTMAATTTLPVESTAVAAAATTASLAADGLGLVAFGAAPDPAIATLSESFGAPAEDSGWVEATSSPFGVCPGAVVRGVRWGPLRVLFSDPGDGTPARFFTYVYSASLVTPGEDTARSSGLKTATDIGLASTLDELRAAYPAVQVFSDVYGPTFSIDADASFSGTLSAETPDAIITAIVGGTSCGE